MIRINRWAFCFFLMAILCSFAHAVDVRLEWVEVHVSLHQDGNTEQQYISSWQVNSGTMGGFYFQGFARNPRFVAGDSFVQFNGKRIPLTIKKLSAPRYDVFTTGWDRVRPGSWLNSARISARRA